jgi:tetratricopeptide (TPR) repeat protein
MSEDQSEAEALMDRGWELLRRNKPREALKVGRRLQAMRYSGGFEMQALALSDLRRQREAIAVLEEGVETVPDIWLLWQLLGNFRSDEGDYEGAFAAYDKALACDCDPTEVQYNYANALIRAGRWTEALERLESLSDADLEEADPPLAGYIVDRHEDALRALGREEEADALVERHAGLIAKAALHRG